jgi:hypothetical protein
MSLLQVKDSKSLYLRMKITIAATMIKTSPAKNNGTMLIASYLFNDLFGLTNLYICYINLFLIIITQIIKSYINL